MILPSQDELPVEFGVDHLILLGQGLDAGIHGGGHVVQRAPVLHAAPQVLLQHGADLGVGAGPLDEVGPRLGGADVRLIVVVAAQGGHLEAALAAPAPYQEADAQGQRLGLPGAVPQDLEDLFKGQVLDVVLVQGVDNAHGGQGIPRKAHADIPVDLAQFGQFLGQDIGLVPLHRFLHHAPVTGHGAKILAAYGQDRTHIGFLPYSSSMVSR